MHPLLNIAVTAARKAGDIIIRHVERIDRLTIKAKEYNDFVSQVDRHAEDEIIYTLRKAHPDHAILAEESGAHDGSAEFQWVIDPLDGTTNFLHGFPVFAVSIAVKHRGVLEHGVVYDPMRQELFTASRGGGAQLDDKRIRVSQQKTLEVRSSASGSHSAKTRISNYTCACSKSWHAKPPVCAAPARLHWTWPMLPPGVSTAFGKWG